MSTLLAPVAHAELLPQDGLALKRFTIREFLQFFPEEAESRRYELLEGEVFEIMPEGSVHIFWVQVLMEWLSELFGVGMVRDGHPILIREANNRESQLFPDISVVRRKYQHYYSRLPEPADLLLIVEISHTTLTHDLGRKAELYARAGIPEYWVLDVPTRTLHIHRVPGEDRYTDVSLYSAEQPFFYGEKPEKTFRLNDAFLQAE